jgi:archaellum component FlaC
MQINKRIQLSLLVAIFAMAIVSAFLPVYAITVSVTPSTAYVGSTVTISGQATPLALVDIYIDRVKVATIGAGIHGDFSTPFEVPELTFGNHTIGVYDTAAGTWAYTTLTIIPNVVPYPKKGAPSYISGLTVTLKGTGYHARSTVTLRFDSKIIGTTVTNEKGTCTLNFSVPDHEEGTAIITGIDAEGAFGNGTFEVIPDILVVPSSGNGNATSITITGAGFAANGVINASTIAFINRHTGDSINVTHPKITITATGNFSATTVYLPRLCAGLYDIKISEKAGHIHTFLGKYRVYPIINLIPSYGKPGDTIKVEGFGFGKKLGVKIYFDDVVVATSTTDDSGHFNTTFVVPISFLGGHYVKAVDDESNSDSATFNIGPKISLSPMSGTVGPTTTVDANGVVSGSIFTSSHVYPEVTVNGLNYRGSYSKTIIKTLGTKVTVTGVGFSPNSFVNITVTIMTYDSYKEKFGTYDLLVVLNAPTDEKGTFTASFIFPTAPSGSYLVSAVDLRFQKAVDYFTVVPGMIIDPPVVVGPSLEKIIATGFPVTTKNWVYNFLINGTDALYGTNLQAITQWRFDGNGTLRGSQLVPEVEPAIPGFILPILEPGLYQITLVSGIPPKNASDYVIVMNVVHTLSDTNAKIDSIIGTIAIINTNIGTIIADVKSINATIVKIKDGVAVIQTSLGDVKTSLSSINATIIRLDNNIATISTTVGKINASINDIGLKVVAIDGTVATIKTDVGTISGKITSIDGNVATIKTDVGTVKADISTLKSSVDDIKDTVETVPGAVSSLVWPIWVAVVLSLIAAVAAIYAVITIRRKIAG